MAQVVRAALTPLLQRQLLHFLSLQTPTVPYRLPFLSHHRNAHLQPRALRPPQELDLEKDSRKFNITSESDDDDGESKRRSRNEMKREARQAVRWGMDLASFSTPQIKRILKDASLEEEVFEALMLIKRLGSDVREGKRRQFNYIGRLLRDADAQPDLLGALIQATKDGDHSRFQSLAGSENLVDQGVEEQFNESESEQENEDFGDHVILASKWFDGLANTSFLICNSSLLLELRKLVRRVHSLQDEQNSTEEDPEKSVKLATAKKSLIRFLYTLVKRYSSAQNIV